jgi:murein DD-endopeptidase MepM/ murein hydrolase activator NlpD
VLALPVNEEHIDTRSITAEWLSNLLIMSQKEKTMKTTHISRVLFLILLVTVSVNGIAHAQTLLNTPNNQQGLLTYEDEVYGYSVEVPPNWTIDPTAIEGWGGVAQFTRVDKSTSLSVESDWKEGGIRVAIGVIPKDVIPNADVQDERLESLIEAYEAAEKEGMPSEAWKSLGHDQITHHSDSGTLTNGVRRVREVMNISSATHYFDVGEGLLFVWYTPVEAISDPEFNQLLNSLRLPSVDKIGEYCQKFRDDFSVVGREINVDQSLSVSWYEDPPGWELPFVGSYLISQGPGCWSTHQGWLYEAVDYSLSVGTAVQATDAGYVLFAGWSSSGFGNLVKLRHASDGFDSWYGHLNSFGAGITPNHSVWQYQVVGWSGNTGTSTGPHLHFHAKQIGSYDTHWIRTLPGTTWYTGNPYSPCYDGGPYDGEANGG